MQSEEAYRPRADAQLSGLLSVGDLGRQKVDDVSEVGHRTTRRRARAQQTVEERSPRCADGRSGRTLASVGASVVRLASWDEQRTSWPGDSRWSSRCDAAPLLAAFRACRALDRPVSESSRGYDAPAAAMPTAAAASRRQRRQRG